MKQLLFLLGVCFILTGCVESELCEMTIEFTDGTNKTWVCRDLVARWLRENGIDCKEYI